jgi:hypothetical protein
LCKLNISHVLICEPLFKHYCLSIDLSELLSYYNYYLNKAIEDGWLPGDVLDDIPSKYYNGSVICEVSNIYFLWYL